MKTRPMTASATRSEVIDPVVFLLSDMIFHSVTSRDVLHSPWFTRRLAPARARCWAWFAALARATTPRRRRPPPLRRRHRRATRPAGRRETHGRSPREWQQPGRPAAGVVQ